jgi:hypothetical protein
MDKSKEQIIREILEDNFWPDSVESDVAYKIQADDHQRDSGFGYLTVAFSKDGDAWIDTFTESRESCRFRTFVGGGRNHRVRNALIILAEAIRLDLERPVE